MSPSPATSSSAPQKSRRWATVATLVVLFAFVASFSYGLVALSQDAHPLSVVDEHIHFDTAVLATQGEIPWRGAHLGDAVVQEWACGVGHEGGALAYPCGDPRIDAAALPSGKYTTGYGHYPTYFFAAAGFASILHSITGSTDLLDAFRAFSAATMIIGVVLCAVFAWALGLRGAALIAATTLPVAASMVVFTGTIVNPSSTSVLAGALIGGTALLWMRRGHGFLWLAIAVGLCSWIAVTSSLPAGGVLIAMLIVLVGKHLGLRVTPVWNPRWWQFAVLWVLVLLPIVVWGRVIAARATVPDSELYGFLPPSGRKDILINAFGELVLLHTPWRATNGIYARPEGTLESALSKISVGTPVWITVMVFGAIVTVAFLQARSAWQIRRVQTLAIGPGGTKPGFEVSSSGLLAVGMIATVVLYPPALRVSNWITFGFDFPIVDRYSNAFTAAIILAVLVWFPKNRAALITAAAVGFVTAVGTVAAGF